MEKKKGIKTIGMVLGTIVIMGTLIFGPGLLATGDENRGGTENTETPLLSVKTEGAEKRTLHAALEVNGDIVSAQ
ncbi:MAG: hypothetical protein LBJ86_03865, partial [Spirochaetaceae bacterium]|nr:hypothetical protein [Spirochaetaceae bacterium]